MDLFTSCPLNNEREKVTMKQLKKHQGKQQQQIKKNCRQSSVIQVKIMNKIIITITFKRNLIDTSTWIAVSMFHHKEVVVFLLKNR